MTVTQLEKRVSELEKRVSELQARQPQPKRGWRALIGLSTNDPVMQEAMRLALEYREKDRRKARQSRQHKKSKK